jgi:hypothetical protein
MYSVWDKHSAHTKTTIEKTTQTQKATKPKPHNVVCNISTPTPTQREKPNNKPTLFYLLINKDGNKGSTNAYNSR